MALLPRGVFYADCPCGQRIVYWNTGTERGVLPLDMDHDRHHEATRPLRAEIRLGDRA